MHEAIYAELVARARSKPGRLAFYPEIAPLTGLNMDREEDREKISALLGQILEHEVANGRPLLTAIVVHRGNDNNPGEGFFSAATQLGKFNGSLEPMARLEFWVRQVGEVHQYWASH